MPRRSPSRPTLGPSAFLDATAKGADGRATPRRAPGQAAAAWFQRQVDERKPLRLVLRDGSALEGILEWQDRAAVRVNLEGGGHRVVPKSALAYVEGRPGETEPASD